MNNLKIEIDNLLFNVSVARVALTSFISKENISLDEIMEIKTAVSEAITNSIEHAYTNEINKVVITAKLSQIDNMKYLCVIIEDFGKGIEDVELATTPRFYYKTRIRACWYGLYYNGNIYGRGCNWFKCWERYKDYFNQKIKIKRNK